MLSVPKYEELELLFERSSATNPICGLLEGIWTRGGIQTAAGDLVRPRHSVTRRDGVVLYGLSHLLQPRVTLETGFAYGLSSLCVLAGTLGNRPHRHVSIDPKCTRWTGGLGNELIARFAVDFTLLEEPSQLALPRLCTDSAWLASVDMAFVDGTHTFDGALIDFYFVDRLLRAGGLLAIHDVDAPAIETLLRFVTSNRHYAVAAEFPPQMTILRKEAEDDRSWDHFEPFTARLRQHWDRSTATARCN